MESFAAILLGLMIMFVCSNTLRRVASEFRRDARRIPWKPLLIGTLGFGTGVALLIVGTLST